MNKKMLLVGAGLLFLIIIAVVVYFVFFHGKGGEAVDCVGEWEQATLCPTDCGQAASTVSATYKIVTPQAHGGAACEFSEGDTKNVDCLATDECPIDCEGRWGETPCPETCEGTTVKEVYEVLVSGNSTGNKCPFENGAERDKLCPAVPSKCFEYDPTTVYPGVSVDNYLNYCLKMKADGHCSLENVRRNCRNECT
jgi:hypothetical protein